MMQTVGLAEAVSIELDTQDAQTVNAGTSPRAPLADTVLIVEDSRTLAAGIIKLLEPLNLNTVSKSTGRDTIEWLEQNDATLVLLDYHLPDMNGIQVIEELSDKGLEVPFIVSTGEGNEEVAVQLMKLGALDYLVKDNSLLETLPALIEKHLDQIHKNQMLLGAETALQQSESRIKMIVDTAADAFISISSDGTILEWNPAAETVFGWNRQEIVGADVTDKLIPENLREVARNLLLDFENRGDQDSATFYHEMTALRRDGKSIPVTISASAVKSDSIWTFNAFVRDITQRKAMETQLTQSEKMASLGQLAAGVAHEINNPIGYVTSNMSALEDYVEVFKDLLEKYDSFEKSIETSAEENGELRKAIHDFKDEEGIDEILEDVQELFSESKSGLVRVKEIVQDLKSFVRLDEAEVNEVNINDGIQATLKLVWNELKYKCDVKTDLGELPNIRCYAGQLNQVFMNLLINASHAIPEKGEISVQTEATDDEIIVRVSDTGSGIPEENIGQLFTPFFTTKPVGKGTGLGLSISYGIVEKHNGVIEVESEVGKGTTFTIRLPIEGIEESGKNGSSALDDNSCVQRL